MPVEISIQYFAIAISILTLIIKHKGMKKYVPVALFASLYANIWGYIAKYFNFWSYPIKLFPVAEDLSLVVDIVVVPVIAMFWVRYCPKRFKDKLFWALEWTVVLSIIEFFLEKYTDAMEYGNGYAWYHSSILWFISGFIWLGFHLWLNDWKRDIDNIFNRY
ncbi:CBO0543 family protein [Thermohalobacter berrensis]|uniref:Competence protein n=1 Tax=Thermohalobacter berrensis TaxID=99594 RepID=A0A419T3C3_9FIRM|nr:CBO0543 family protein [Thermohalobacter berrensis]RKD31962.1 competence protein [Thermohalobacter berrensis]